MKTLLAEHGFNEADAPVLDLIRQSLAQAAHGKAKPRKALADEILALSRSGDAGYEARAALLKTLKHTYFVERKGRQSIWAVDHPRAYEKWAYDKLTGTQPTIHGFLERETEAFGAGNRRMFSSAVDLARKISMDVCVKLTNKDARTLRKVRKWFLDDTATDADFDKTVEVLSDGFKKVSALLNTNTIIFSDRPHKRVDPASATTKASVNSGDKMPVIYIFKLFLDYGRMNRLGVRSRLWQCAKTIIHELSHKILDTDDHAYGVNGIKPGTSVSVAKAIKNADSWGIFALDAAGYLPARTAAEAYS